MAKALLVVPPFWDPICVPMGITSLKAYAERKGHHVDLFDFNTVPSVFLSLQAYFNEGKRQFPFWKNWYIERNAAEALALHQVVYLRARHRPDYRELVAEVLNLDRRPLGAFMEHLDVGRFDDVFDDLYARIGAQTEKLLRQSRPDVVGCTLLNATWPGAVFILQLVKELMPRVRTVVGGAGPLMGISARAEEVRTFFDAHDCIDYYVLGEGEEAFVDILEKPDMPRGILDALEGMTTKEAQHAAVKLKELPTPDYGTLETDRYLQLAVTSSRGCPFECSFCSETVFWKGFRNLGKSDTFQRIDELATRHKKPNFFVCDSLSNHIIRPLTAEIAASGKPYKLDCHLRADEMCTKEERAKSWAEGGLYRARMGMESASQRILDAMVKMTNPENMAKSLWALGNAGVMTTTLWIIYYPGETEDEFRSTLRFIGENKDHIYQTDAQVFQYHPAGLSHSKEIGEEAGCMERFSSDLNDVLSLAPTMVERNFSAGEAFDRLERWVAEMDRLGIPNPKTAYQWMKAEERWRGLGHQPSWGPSRNILAV